MQGFDMDEACGHTNLGDRAAVAVADQLIDSRALEPIELSGIGSTDVLFSVRVFRNGVLAKRHRS
jgi:hypothetical protein